MKSIALNVLLGATMLLMPWLVSKAHISGLFRFSVLPHAKQVAGDLTCDDFDACPKDWSLVASPFLVPCGEKCDKETCCASNQDDVEVKVADTEESMRTCDDFGSCPQGWSLVASPALVVCGKTCEKETCCLDDAAVEVVQGKQSPRRLDISENETQTTTNTTTTTVTTTTTEYAPIANTTTNTTTATTSTTTATTTTATTTTTELIDEEDPTTVTVTETATSTLGPQFETVLEGYILMNLDDAEAFLNDPLAQAALVDAIATTSGIPSDWVKIAVQLGTIEQNRRLSAGSSPFRRLAVGDIIIYYTITVPSDSPVAPADIGTILSDTPVNTFRGTFEAKLVEKGARVYVTTVQKINAPTSTIQTWTTTTTMTAADLEDDSFAFTRVAFSPAHVLALLAVSVSALSF